MVDGYETVLDTVQLVWGGVDVGVGGGGVVCHPVTKLEVVDHQNPEMILTSLANPFAAKLSLKTQ